MEEKNNTTMTIIIVVIVLLIVGLIAYFVMNNNKTDDNINEPNITDNDTLDDTSDETKDVAGAYTGTYNKNTNVVEDAADAITDNDSDRVVVELLLKKDGTATFVKTGDEDETIKGTYTTSNDKVTLTSSNDTDNIDNDTTADKHTHEFTINADGSLTYKDDATSTDTVTLNKTDEDNLKHIK
ncbi:MAG: hypothetical protein HFH45_04575 [Bacilli bacterium]|nr:hypothetical protein [Bacilli bacterium]